MATMTPARSTVFSLPNQLTLGRFLLALVLFVLIAAECWAWCLVVFLLATVTDWLDGYLARVQNLTSTLGRNLDPLVDKVLMCGAFIFLLPLGSRQGWLLPWMVTLVVARELFITGLRSFLETHGAVFGADWLGKIKMALQCAVLIAVFVALESARWLPGASATLGVVRDVLMYAMLLATLLSALQYAVKAAGMLRNLS